MHVGRSDGLAGTGYDSVAILVLEEDEDYSGLVAYTLQRDSQDVIVATTLAEAEKVASHRAIELAVVGLALGADAGLGIYGRLRVIRPRLPVMVLSPQSRSADVVACLEAGADDYLTKPFHPRELLARARALVRRSQPTAREVPSACRDMIAAHGIRIDPVTSIVDYKGVALNCTAIEIAILEQLVRYAGQLLPYGFLNREVWGYANIDDSVLLKGHVSSIRRKLVAAGGCGEMVRTVYGAGYSFVPA